MDEEKFGALADVVVEHVSKVEIVCNVDQIGDWVKIFNNKDFEVYFIDKHCIDNDGNYTSEETGLWVVAAQRTWSMDERWEV